MFLNLLNNVSAFKLSRFHCRSAKNLRVSRRQLHSTAGVENHALSSTTLRRPSWTPIVNISRGRKRLTISKLLDDEPTKPKGISREMNVSRLIVPVEVPASADESNVGSELSGEIKQELLVPILSKFYQRQETRQAANEEGLDSM